MEGTDDAIQIGRHLRGLLFKPFLIVLRRADLIFPVGWRIGRPQMSRENHRRADRQGYRQGQDAFGNAIHAILMLGYHFLYHAPAIAL